MKSRSLLLCLKTIAQPLWNPRIRQYTITATYHNPGLSLWKLSSAFVCGNAGQSVSGPRRVTGIHFHTGIATEQKGHSLTIRVNWALFDKTTRNILRSSWQTRSHVAQWIIQPWLSSAKTLHSWKLLCDY